MSKVDQAKKLAVQNLNLAMDKAAAISRPAIHAHIRQSQRSREDAAPAEIVIALERRFTAAVTASGGAVGGVAAAPAIGLGPSLALGAGDAVFFTSAAAFYILSLAEIYGVPVDELERRRTLLLGVLLGNVGSQTVQEAAGRSGAYWGKNIVRKIPISNLKQINKVLGHNFVTKYGTKQGILVLGKAIPFGIGVLIGGGGNAAFARMTVASGRRAFGPAPAEWPDELRPSTLLPTAPANEGMSNN